MYDPCAIPFGDYCYDENGVCPYWSLVEVLDETGIGEGGYCLFLDEFDSILLWDLCKICGINECWDCIDFP